ncbi:unnamed protein product [Rhizoctonia solani]|uniref:Uncharacterized protein n=1 Tax=Rhizoctonia solani TaxID=456999 RepID=A0A8H3AUR6_9AGAM|nr:unnamed protein product [Rhizoctonia solani]
MQVFLGASPLRLQGDRRTPTSSRRTARRAWPEPACCVPDLFYQPSADMLYLTTEATQASYTHHPPLRPTAYHPPLGTSPITISHLMATPGPRGPRPHNQLAPNTSPAQPSD